MARYLGVACLLIVSFLATGCDKAQSLIDDAKKEADKLAAAPGDNDVPNAQDDESPPAPPMAVAPAALDDTALIAQWHATTPRERSDASLRALLKASPASLQEITSIDLRGAGPQLTAAGLRLLKNLPLVKSVDCSLHRLDGEQFAALCALPELEDLNVMGCGLNDSHLAPLKKVAALRRLNLTNNQVSDNGLAAIHNLVEVQSLTLANTQVSGSCLLKAKFLGGLRAMNVDGAPFNQGFQALKSAPNLQSLDVANTGASDAHLKFLSGHKQLREIRLQGNRSMGDLGMSYLQGNPLLESLDIRGTSISGAPLRFLTTAKKLKVLHTQESRVDPATLAALRQALPDCAID